MRMVWVITRSINEYDQDGNYFFAFFFDRPTLRDLKKLFGKNSDIDFLTNLLNGGGRIGTEHTWYYLTQLEEAKEYEEK